ncbi:MAG TPA: hypothetical protein VGS22_12820 [Thermoanaerobaculia bacterium]|jgi:hypothetical protein|nr:hypothetical protein [Thermoanaerobaculia bacterium]
MLILGSDDMLDDRRHTKIVVLEGFRRRRVQYSLFDCLRLRNLKSRSPRQTACQLFQPGRAIWWVGKECSRKSFLDRRLAQAEAALAEAECRTEDA